MTGDPLDRRQCTATSKRSGVRCKRAPIKGGMVCAMHGGKSPAVAAAAADRQAAAEAEKVVRRLWAGLDDAAPVKDPVASMERLAGTLEAAADDVGARVNELRSLSGGSTLTQLRGEVVLLERLVGHLRGLLVDMARLGIAERHVQLESDRAQMVTAAFLAALDVGGLVPEVRSLMIDRFLSGLGDLVPGEVVA